MESKKQIKSALISVFYKNNLEPIIHELAKNDVVMYSTGGTQKFIEDLGYKVVPVEDLTSYPSILGGRVKTLHPKVFGGILNRRDHEGDQAQLAEFEIPEIDLVIVDLYPFEETVASGAPEADIIEKIDIGGISLIRAAAKNFKDVTIVSSRNDYSEFLEDYIAGSGELSLAERKKFATNAFAVSSHYDTAIHAYMAGEEVMELPTGQKALRYGENPHQKASFLGGLENMFDVLNGKELSYNNILDVDAAVNIIGEFDDCTFAVLKHNNACGIASRSTVFEAWKEALSCDPVSAFGGVLITNAKIDLATAESINELFYEVLIAPAYDADALELLKSKSKRIVLRQKPVELPNTIYRSALNGVLVQERDNTMEGSAEFNVCTDKAPTTKEIEDLAFANKIAKHTKSNTIVLAKDKKLVASGTGQTSRVDALKQSIVKAEAFGFDVAGSVMASDAFFPFADCVEIAHNAGVNAVVQPGGSIRDKDSIEYCNSNDMSMVLTSVRHFKH